MPDVDIVHGNVSRKFWHVYKQLCEGVLTPDDLAGAIAKALIKTLKDEGRSPSELIFSTLKSVFSDVGIGMPIDGSAAGRLIDKLASTSLSQSRYVSLAVEAVKAGLAHATNLHDYGFVTKVVLREYTTRLLDADLLKRMPLANQYMNASSEEIAARLKEAEPNIESQLTYIVDQMARHESVEKLQKKRAKRNESVDFSNMDMSLPRVDSEDGEQNGK